MTRTAGTRWAMAGYARSLEFAWAASAEAHMASYERAAAQGRGVISLLMPTDSASLSCPRSASLGDREPLEAILLVGGQGTRLRPLTISVPKPLLPTAGVPFLAHQLARAAALGHHHGRAGHRLPGRHVRRSASATARRSGWSSPTSTRPSRSAPAAAIRNAAAGLRSGPDNPVVVLNGDVLSGHDLQAQLDLHRKADAAVTLHLVEVPDPARFGCVPTDADGRVTAFLEKTPDPVTNQINAGCYVFTRSVHRPDAARPGGSRWSGRPSRPDRAAAEVVMGYLESAYWLDVGTPEAFVRGICDLVLGRLHSPGGAGAVRAGAAAAGRGRRSVGPAVRRHGGRRRARGSAAARRLDGSRALRWRHRGRRARRSAPA